MVDYTSIIRELLNQGDIPGAIVRVQGWLEADSDDMGVWLAVMDAFDHDRLKKERFRRPFASAMCELAEWISDVDLAWDMTLVLGQVVESDDLQHATSLWIHFVERFPAHEAGLAHLVDLVLEDGDYRAASWALEELAVNQPALASRFYLAVGILDAGCGFWETAQKHFKRSGQSNAAIREALAVHSYHFPEESLPDWLAGS